MSQAVTRLGKRGDSGQAQAVLTGVGTERPSRSVFTPVVGASIAVLALGYVFAIWSQLGLNYDGSFFALHILDQRTFTITPDTYRFTAALWQLPAVIASQLDASPTVVKTMFSLGYGLTELILIAVVLVLLRPIDDKPETRTRFWIGLLGMSVALIPTLSYWLSEAMFSFQLGWAGLALLVSPRAPWKVRAYVAPVFGLLAVFQHPFGIIACIAMAVVAATAGDLPYIARRAAALVLLAIASIGLLFDWPFGHVGVVGGPIALVRDLGRVYLLLCAAAAGLAFGAYVVRHRAPWMAAVLSAASVTAPFVAVVIHPRQDPNARFALIITESAAYAALIVSARLPAVRAYFASIAPPVAFFPAAAMAVALILSGNAWRNDVAWVNSQIQSATTPCLNRAALSGDALANGHDWHTLPLSLIEQGLRPRVILTTQAMCDRLSEDRAAMRVFDFDLSVVYRMRAATGRIDLTKTGLDGAGAAQK